MKQASRRNQQNKPASQTKCPIETDSDPRHLTLDEAIERSLNMCGYMEDGWNEDDFFSLLWRIHTLPTKQAAQWLKKIEAAFHSYTHEPDNYIPQIKGLM